MTTYLLKSSACLALFYLVYLLLFRNANRFQLNRVYLLMGLVLSFILPILVVPVVPLEIVATTVQQVHAIGEIPTDTNTVPAAVETFSGIQVLYIAGTTMALLITLASVLRTLSLYRSGTRIRRGKYTFVVNSNTQPFSFFGLLFVPSANEEPMIVEHETVHIRQRHWIDLVVMEIAAVVLWFNPIVYFYKKSIAIQHEYIADQNVVSHVPIKDYLHCIVQQLEANVLSAVVSGFNTQYIKQRIIMMTSTKTYSALRYTMALPVIFILTVAFANPLQNGEFRSPVDVDKLRKEPGAGFGNRMNPATHKEVFHTGVDLITAAGNSVYAVANGVVEATENTDERGNFILITHDKTLSTSYSHLEKIVIKKGARVQKGQLIGLVGSTGLSTGPHLHFEVLKDGKAVDPVPYLNMSLD